MRGYLDRDANGFWVACVVIEQAATRALAALETCARATPCPFRHLAPREVAEAAFRRFMSREARKRHGR